MSVKIMIVLIVAVIAVVFFFMLKSPIKPTLNELEISAPEEHILQEINSGLIQEFQNQEITDEEIRRLVHEHDQLWDLWQKRGYSAGNSLTVDFYYYAAAEANAKQLKNKLEKEGFVVFIYPQITFGLKGWQIKTQIRRNWDLSTFKKYLRIMALLGQNHETPLESYAAATNDNQNRL